MFVALSPPWTPVVLTRVSAGRYELRMTMLPAAAPSWCPNCGQPWEAHWRCPPPRKRGTGKLIVLAVLVGVVLLVESVALAAYLDGALTRHQHFSTAIRSRVNVGPVQPRVQACELFYAWEKTRNPSLLNRAVADAHSSRVPLQFKPRFISVFSGLRRWTWEGAHSPKAISSEHAVQVVCKRQVTAGLNWRHRPAFRRAIAQFSRPSTAKDGQRAPASR